MQDYVRRILTSSVYEVAEETPLDAMPMLSARLGADNDPGDQDQCGAQARRRGGAVRRRL